LPFKSSVAAAALGVRYRVWPCKNHGAQVALRCALRCALGLAL
jgi:hypothetical protein